MSHSRRPNEQNGVLPTFTSIHDQPERNLSYAESSQASSSRSAAARSDTHSDNGSQTRPTSSPGHGPVPSTISGAFRKSKRSSGGFLLSSTPNSSRLSRSILSKSQKGKQRPGGDDTLSVPKTRHQVDGAASRSSWHASSPLSADATDDLTSHAQETRTESSTPSLRPPHTNASVRSGQSTSSHPNSTSYGFDTDPAQIVDMALRLNEARRRQISARRQLSTTSEARRVVSAATSLPARASPPRSSPAPLQSRRKSMNPEPMTPSKRSRAISAESDARPTHPMTAYSPDDNEEDEEDSMHVSRATLARVAKAQQYFELAYEHRRLLSHLPPLRRPDQPYDHAKLGYDSKTYNPLQYARNRKLRFRERAPINSEAEGWHDVDKVRAWVNAVVNSHVETKHNPIECIRLPPLSLADEDNLDDGHERPTKPEKHGRPRRPKSDWVTHPGDLIADAYWTEQGLNKKKIYNRDNEPIFPPGTVFRFSGWRNRTPVDVPDDLKQTPSSSNMSPPPRETVAAAPELPTFESAHKDNGWAKTKSKFGQALKKTSRTKRDQDAAIFDTSSESSDSESGTDQERKRLSKKRRKMAMLDGDPFAPPTQASKHDPQIDGFDADETGRESERSSVEHANLLKYLRRNSTNVSAGNESSDARKTHKRRNFLKSLNIDPDERGRSSFEYDSTAPGTPVGHGFPSIAINLSPPASRSPSPSRKHKGSLLDVVKDKVQPHKDRIDRADFAVGQESAQSSKRGSIALSKGLTTDRSRGTSPTSRGTSPFTRQRNSTSQDETLAPGAGVRGSTISKGSSKTADSDRGRSHRVRGMFKGGRIAELVGTEVSRVGDFIWKREPPRNGGSDTGSSSGYESDSDDVGEEKMPDDGARNDQLRPSLARTASAAKKPELGSGHSQSSSKESPQYHIQGLPSFTSPFQRDRDEQRRRKASQSPGGTPQQDSYDSDPVSTAARARRMAGKSPRLDRLQPPRLDTSGASPVSRRNSYGFGAALDLSRTKSASQLYNDAINGQPPEPSTSRQFRSAAFASSPFASTVALSRYVSNDQSRSRTRQKVTTRDYVRIRALLVATAVKATNLADYCEAIPQPQSNFLYEVFRITGGSSSDLEKVLPAPRKDEHVIAARHLIGHLHNQFSDFNDHLDTFTKVTTQDIHREMQILEDKTEHTLFPRLQKLSDQAGQLAQKLTTTSTLAVKSVNDEVGEAMRMKRRGPYKFGRALWYKLIEWGVVSMLWLIWFVVTMVRFGIGTITTIWAIFAWLFFLR